MADDKPVSRHSTGTVNFLENTGASDATPAILKWGGKPTAFRFTAAVEQNPDNLTGIKLEGPLGTGGSMPGTWYMARDEEGKGRLYATGGLASLYTVRDGKVYEVAHGTLGYSSTHEGRTHGSLIPIEASDHFAPKMEYFVNAQKLFAQLRDNPAYLQDMRETGGKADPAYSLDTGINPQLLTPPAAAPQPAR